MEGDIGMNVGDVKGIIDRREYVFARDDDDRPLGIDIGIIRMQERRREDEVFFKMLDMRSGLENVRDDTRIVYDLDGSCGVLDDAIDRARRLGLSCPSVIAILAEWNIDDGDDSDMSNLVLRPGVVRAKEIVKEVLVELSSDREDDVNIQSVRDNMEYIDAILDIVLEGEGIRFTEANI